MSKEEIKNILHNIIKHNVDVINKINDNIKIIYQFRITNYTYWDIAIEINNTFNINTYGYMICPERITWIDRSVNELVEFINKQINKE